MLKQITSGKWEARTLHGADEAGGWIYFSGTERSHIGGDVYRIRMDGSGLQRLTDTPGSHAANFDPTFKHFIDMWSDAMTPGQVRLHSSDGKLVRVIDENKVDKLKEYKLSKPEFMQVARDGFRGDDEACRFRSSGYPFPAGANGWGGRRCGTRCWRRGLIIWICDTVQPAEGWNQRTIYKNLER